MLTFNNDIMGLQPSRSMAFMAKAKQMQATDPSVINLAGGEPDFDTPFQKFRQDLQERNHSLIQSVFFDIHINLSTWQAGFA